MNKKIGELEPMLIGGQIVRRYLVDGQSGEKAVDENRGTIMAKTIGNGEIIDECIEYNDYSRLEPEKLTRVGDIVVKLPAPYGAAIIDENHEGLFVSSFSLIIRGFKNELIDKNYLVALLNSEYVKSQLDNMVVSNMITTLSMSKLLNVSIPIPPIEKQKEIGDLFLKSVHRRQIINKINQLEDEKLSSMIYALED